METTERFNVIFPEYPETVRIAESRKKKLILWTDNPKPMHKKKLDAKEYTWKNKIVIRGGQKQPAAFLFDIAANDFVAANPKTAGTPRDLKINSQIVWESGNIQAHNIRRIKEFLSEWFKPGIVRQLPEKIFTPSADTFIHIEYIFFYPFTQREPRVYQDYINHWYMRGKIFEDTLVELGVIPDDGPRYIRGGYARFVNIDTEADRRLEVKIHFCKNNQRIS